MLRDEATRLALEYPELEIATAVIAGAPAGVLIEESKTANLVVVGSRGLGGFTGLLAGSVSAQVATHAKAPVIVIRPPADKTAVPELPNSGPVVVGADGSSGSAAAVAFAFEEAAARGGDLIAIYAWGTQPGSDTPQEEQAQAERVLGGALTAWQEKFPEVRVQARTIHSMVPVHTILDESGDASLIVVGPRGHGGFAGLLLGSVGDGLVRHAHIPVAVVHTRPDTTS
jgi:nucleotide-binding universal stress UspA family protein